MSTPTPKISQAQIAERAFILWEQAGRPEGRDLDFWLRAEYSLTIEQSRPAEGSAMPQAEDVPGASPNVTVEGGTPTPGKPGGRSRAKR